MTGIISAIWIAVLWLAQCNFPGTAKIPDQWRALRHLDNVRVRVNLRTDVELGMTTDDIVRRTEKALQDAGIATQSKSLDQPLLYVFVTVMRVIGTQSDLFTVSLQLCDKVEVRRIQRNELIDGVLWQRSAVSHEEDWFMGTTIERVLDDLLSEFVADHRKANSSGGESEASSQKQSHSASPKQ